MKSARLIAFLLICAWLLWNPLTRQIIVIVLPLGSGIDDLIIVVLVILAVVIGFVQGWVNIPSLFNKRGRK